MSEHCLFCGQSVRAELDGACLRCGAVRETVDEKRVRARCPRCHDVRLAPFALGPVALHACGRCKGSFLPATEWDILLDTFANVPLPDPIAIPSEEATNEGRDPYRSSPVMVEAAQAKPNLDEVVVCPTCDQPMERIDFARMSGVIVDVCKLHGIWLDGGELARVVEESREHVPGTITNDVLDGAVTPRQWDPIAPEKARALVDALIESRRDLVSSRPESSPRRGEPATVQAGRLTSQLLHGLNAIVRSIAALIRQK